MAARKKAKRCDWCGKRRRVYRCKWYENEEQAAKDKGHYDYLCSECQLLFPEY